MTGSDIIITGIPRSGTSYLCGLLDKVKNNVVINEPESMSFHLSEESEPRAVASYYQAVRESILSGKEIKNKMLGGKIIEDTAFSQNFEMYHPSIENNNFSLCTKNTLGYLSRLDKFQAIMPKSPIFACIRNPVDTIASWKTTFDHLKKGLLATDFLIGSKKDIYLSEWQKERVTFIAKEDSEVRRRALIWAYLAEWIWMNRDRLIIVNYNDVVLTPETITKCILSETGNIFELDSAMKSSKIRTDKRQYLDEEDFAAIEEYCFPIAKKMGLLDS